MPSQNKYILKPLSPSSADWKRILGFFAGPFVAFVTSTFDIPTPGVTGGGAHGGGSSGDDDGDSAGSNEAGNAMEGSGGDNPIGVSSLLPGAVEVQTGAGDSGAGTASAMKSCSLVMTGDTLHSVSFGANLLWLFFAAIVIGGLRAVKVRVRKK